MMELKKESAGRKPMKRYDIDFKRAAVDLVVQAGRKACEVEQELGLYQGAISVWKKELGVHDGTAFPGRGYRHQHEQEVHRLAKELKQARMENEILKKAMGYFARNPS
jgi:transposase